jgi:stage V sporulation protein B
MDKATEMAKTSTYNSIQVFLGTSVSTVIRALGAIILGLLILPSDMGLYVVALIPSTTLSMFQDWGVSTALGRYLAKYRATNEQSEQRKVVLAGLVYIIITGSVLTITSLILVNFFAFTVYHRPESAFLIGIVSVTILSGTISSGIQSMFVGFEQMKYNSYLAIISAVTYSLFAPLLVYLGYGAIGAVIGFTISSVIQGVLYLLFLYFFVLKKLLGAKVTMSEIGRTIIMLLRFGVPLGIGGLVGNLGTPFFSFLMATYVTDIMIGNWKIATNFVILITFVTVPIGNVLFPAFSKIDPKTEKHLIKTIFASSVKYTNIFLVPLTMALAVLAAPLINSIYNDKWPFAAPLLALNIIFYLLCLLGNRSMPHILSAMGETKLLLEMSVISLAISIPVAFILIPSLGLIGMIIGVPIAALPSMFIGLYFIWKHYDAKIDLNSSARIFLSSILATAAVYLVLNFFNASYWILLAGGSILFLTIYLVSIPLVGAVNLSDVNNLRIMFSDSRIMSKVLEIPLRMTEELLKVRNSSFKAKSS